MSFLRSEGHTEAGEYPLWKVHFEMELARQRVNDRTKAEMVLTSMAVAAHKGKNQFKAFKNALESVDG